MLIDTAGTKQSSVRTGAEPLVKMLFFLIRRHTPTWRRSVGTDGPDLSRSDGNVSALRP